MKKLLTLLLIVLVSFGLIGCSNKYEPDENLYKEYETLDEINNIANVTILNPAIMGIEDQHYYIVESNTASTTLKINGYTYHIRGTKEINFDMSGVFKDGKCLFDGAEGDIQYGETDEYKVYRFFLGNIQYIFAVKDKGEIDKKVFSAQFEDYFNMMCYEPSYDIYKQAIGSYQDSWSQRATAEVSFVNVNKLKIDIMWSSSASEYDEWIVVVSPPEEKIEYKEIEHKRVVIGEDGRSKETPLDDYGPGYFEYVDQKLLWTGSGNDETSSCVFEKVEIVN